MKGAAGRLSAGMALLVASLVLPPALPAAGPPDRLERFQELVAHPDPATPRDVLSDDTIDDIYALIDGEVLESLASGGVFASSAFIQDRLHAFMETWGGVTVRLLTLDHLLLVACQFNEGLPRGSVRVYERRARQAAVLSVLDGPGLPSLHPLPRSQGGDLQFLVLWEGQPAGPGRRPLRFDVVREHAGRIETPWTSADLFPNGLSARWYAVRGAEVTVHYQARYPGWTPGCEQQTEHEDVYRVPPAGGRVERIGRRVFNPWHRDVHAAAAHLFRSLAAGESGALTSLVPDRGLRSRLPVTLRGEPACDAQPSPDGMVSIAALAESHQPWTLTFRQRGGHWRLVAAGPTVP